MKERNPDVKPRLDLDAEATYLHDHLFARGILYSSFHSTVGSRQRHKYAERNADYSYFLWEMYYIKIRIRKLF